MVVQAAIDVPTSEYVICLVIEIHHFEDGNEFFLDFLLDRVWLVQIVHLDFDGRFVIFHDDGFVDYVINGSKLFITNGLQADWMCCLCNTSDDSIHKNKSLIIIPMDTPGITRHKIRKIGLMSSDTAQIFFDDVRVPQRNLIGEEGQGFIYQMQQFQEERLFIAARGPAMMEEVINMTIDYTRERKAFGKSILDNQVVHFRLAELQTEVEALRALTWAAIEKYMAGEDVTMLASMAKLKTGRLQREVADSCLQYWGGHGYVWEAPIARRFRDFRITSIGGGADEIMLQVISKLMNISPSTRA